MTKDQQILELQVANSSHQSELKSQSLLLLETRAVLSKLNQDYLDMESL